MTPTTQFARARTGPSAALPALVARLSAARSMDEISTAVTQAVRALLGADGATFVLRDADRCHYADEDAISPLWKGQRFPMKACISGWCMLHGQPVAVPDIYRDARIPADAYRPTFVRSLAMAPVRREHPIAALGAYWSEVREITPEEVELLQAIADATALSIAYIQLQGVKASPRPVSPPPSSGPARASTPPAADKADAAPPATRVARAARERLRPNSAAAYGLAAACVAVATLVRLGLARFGLHGVAPFGIYALAVLVTTLLAGARAGLAALALGAGAAALMFQPGGRLIAEPTMPHLLNTVLFLGGGALIVWVVRSYQGSLARFAVEDARRTTVAREIQHRSRNALSVVESIVRQSLHDQPDQAQLVIARIRAGLAPVDVTGAGETTPATLRALLAAELAAFDLSRFALESDEDGPVAAELRSPLMLMVHELATNAVKHGALSEPAGRVTVTWWTAGGRRVMRWVETGGPPVARPESRGYGSLFLRRLAEAFGGEVRADFRPSGLVAEISLPLAPGRRA